MEQEFLSREEIVDIVITHKRKYFNNLRLHVFNPYDLDDAFQDCFLSLLNRQILKDNAVNFLSSCFYYWGIDTARKLQRKNNNISICNIDISVLSDNVAEEYFPEIGDDFGCLEDFLEDAIKNSKLSALQIEILKCHYFEGIRFKEIAKKLKISNEACRGYSFNALCKIRDYLDTKMKDKYSFVPVTDELISKCNPEDKIFLEILKETNKISYNKRKILDLFIFKRLDYCSIAKITGASEVYISRLIYRIRKKTSNKPKVKEQNWDIVLNGGYSLTDKHKEIIVLTSKNVPPHKIAKEIGVSSLYVRNALYYLRNLYKTEISEDVIKS